MSRASFFIPLTAFVVIAALLYAGFSLNDPHELPSALIGKPFPAFDLPSLDNVVKVVVDEGSIGNDTRPILIYADQPKVAGSV